MILNDRVGQLIPEMPPKEILTFSVRPFGEQWTVSSDNKRFLVLVDANEVRLENEASSGPMHLKRISNGFTELNKAVPVGKK